MEIIDRVLNFVLGEPWGKCLNCSRRIYNPENYCPRCGQNIDHQYSGYQIRGITNRGDEKEIIK